MAKVIRFHATGGPEVLRVEEQDVGQPGPGQVRLTHHAIGLNFADSYFRSGLYPPMALPSGVGTEAAGVVDAIGEGVSNVAVGDRVTYTGAYNTLGAYSTERLIAANVLIKLPDAISFETAAAMTMRGLTSSYLMRRIWPLKAGDTVLLHAAAGGVGLIVSQWAKLLGLNVIGSVSTDEKAALAKAHGCNHVIVYRREDIAKRVRELTNGVGANVVFDSVGKNTFAASLDSVKRRGLLVCLGTASGPTPPSGRPGGRARAPLSARPGPSRRRSSRWPGRPRSGGRRGRTPAPPSDRCRTAVSSGCGRRAPRPPHRSAGRPATGPTPSHPGRR